MRGIELKQKLVAEIVRFLTENPANSLPGSGLPYFEEPLVGFAAATDPQFSEYKTIIGDFHLTPGELFAGEFGAELTAGTVVSWILPITEVVRTSNRYQAEFPSREWSQTRNFGEVVNSDLRRHVSGWLQSQGYRAVAPQLSTQWKELSETPKGRASTWSERHAAYAAGLGTFSLNDALITEKGIAHRCGSVITDLVVEPSIREDKGYAWNCLFYRDGSCGACIGRCPVGAISFAGHDKTRCCEYVCGLCQTRVPCESGIPRSRN